MATLQVSAFALSAPIAGSRLQVSRVEFDAPVAASTLQVASASFSAGVVIAPDSTLQVARASFGAAVSNSAPVVSVSPTTLVVDAGTEFKLVGVDSDADGVVVSRSWSYGGDSWAAAEVTLLAPIPALADETRVYTYSATDNSGMTTTATATVTIRKAQFVGRLPDGTFVGHVLRDKVGT